MTKVVSLFESQPARMYIYPGLIALVAYLVSKGAIDSDTASWITGIIAAAVGVGATESVHAAVTPNVSVAKQLAAVQHPAPGPDSAAKG